MKVLIITHHYLDISGGASFASRAYINAFAAVAEQCTLLYPENGNDISTYIDPKINAKGIRNKVSRLGKLWDIYCGRINRFYKIIFSEINLFKPDVVVFDNSRTSAGYIKKVKSLGIKVITIHHNYEMDYYNGTKPNVLWRIPFLYYMKEAEKQAVLHSDLNLALTKHDMLCLKKEYDLYNSSKFELVGVFESRISESKLISANSRSKSKLTFIITGSLCDMQTETSLIPFIQRYYPLLIRLFPDSKLIIAGRKPSKVIIDLCSQFSNIELIPNPPSMGELIDMANIYICPINVGSGLKLRVMDGLKRGLPVLSHEVSGRGYEDFIDKKFVLTYNDEESFEQALVSIANRVNNRSDIIGSFNEIFSYDKGLLRLQKILKPFMETCKAI